jgi:hydroxymethylpyrimidine/phosphomethylpyrimidine kinase
MTSQTPIAFTIAGSDPSGGAGIQADLKTFTAIGVYGAAAITSLTFQNTQGVTGGFIPSPDAVRQQIKSVLHDLNVTHIKIGMTGNGEIADSIIEALSGFQGEIIYDPVRISSSGADLMTGNNSNASWKNLISRATVLTPNRSELELLAGCQLHSVEEGLYSAQKMLSRFPRLRILCLTGGHFEGREGITDYMLSRKGKKRTDAQQIHVTPIHHDRIETHNLHGTGCTFASAFTAFHLLTGDDTAAFTKTSHFMQHIIQASSSEEIGHGNGPLVHHLWNTRENR